MVVIWTALVEMPLPPNVAADNEPKVVPTGEMTRAEALVADSRHSAVATVTERSGVRPVFIGEIGRSVSLRLRSWRRPD